MLEKDIEIDAWNKVQTLGKPTPTNPDYLYLEHVNLLLDMMIREIPEDRGSIEEIFEKAKMR